MKIMNYLGFENKTIKKNTKAMRHQRQICAAEQFRVSIMKPLKMFIYFLVKVQMNLIEYPNLPF